MSAYSRTKLQVQFLLLIFVFAFSGPLRSVLYLDVLRFQGRQWDMFIVRPIVIACQAT